MKCNIITIKYEKNEIEIKEVLCYKTEYKNVVITKVDERRYSITHWQTGTALSSNGYRRRKDAFDDLPKVIERARKTKINIKQFCKRNKLKQINF